MALFFKGELSALAHILLQFWRVVSARSARKKIVRAQAERGENGELNYCIV
jgi:hypothetical protein